MGEHATATARAGGYIDTGGGGSGKVHRLIRDTRIQAAITEDAQRRLEGMVPAALHAVHEMISNRIAPRERSARSTACTRFPRSSTPRK